jgi:hypothetical protein
VGSDKSTGLTAPVLAARLEQFGEDSLADQIRKTLDLAGKTVIDDVLLVGCEVTPS